MDKMKMQSHDVTGSNIDKIAKLFPQCVTERKDKDGKTVLGIDFEKLRDELSADVIDDGEERYQFTWPNKKAHAHLANTPTTKTLRPCREESVDFDHTQNIYIEGDNLDVLKIIRETYLGKVKMIYIDPPYNTGNDFVYNDDFLQNADDYQENSGQFDEEGNRLVQNTESNGRFHTDWLNMIYPRLKVAKDLLSDEGYICISIDDNENENLKKICNEIFGETNFVSQFIVIRSEGGGLAKRAVIGHDYLLVYSKNINLAKPLGRPKDIRGKIEIKNGEEFWVETDWFREVFGKYGTCHYEDILKFYDEKKKAEIDLGLNKGIYVLIPHKGKHIIGRYRKVADDTSKFYTIVKHLNKNGVKDLASLKLDKYFDYPKPVSLVADFIMGSTILSKRNNDIVLDFFSGSATTVHAVMQLNAEDGGNRKFIMVQLPEKTDEKSEAYKAGYKNICEIGKERIRRAGKKIKEENADKESIDKLDIGFRVLKLDSSNMQDVYYTPKEFTEHDLFADNVKPDRTAEDLLFQVMLDLGVELSATIEQRVIDGKQVFFVNDNYLVACFDENIAESAITEIAKMKPYYFVMRDSSLASDNVADNFDQLFETYSKDTIRKII
ncbi:site-specific DNA-methyltransferase [Bacteroides fragilis]|nr:site-specific DNA-methyltransferase [Bacteroides fragilis]